MSAAPWVSGVVNRYRILLRHASGSPGLLMNLDRTDLCAGRIGSVVMVYRLDPLSKKQRGRLMVRCFRAANVSLINSKEFTF